MLNFFVLFCGRVYMNGMSRSECVKFGEGEVNRQEGGRGGDKRGNENGLNTRA